MNEMILIGKIRKQIMVKDGKFGAVEGLVRLIVFCGLIYFLVIAIILVYREVLIYSAF